MKFLFLLTFILIPCFGFAQVQRSTASKALGNISQQPYDLNSASINPASMPNTSGIHAEAQLSNLYGISEYSSLQLAVCIKQEQSSLTASLALSAYQYSPLNLGLNFCRKVNDQWRLAIGLSYQKQAEQNEMGYRIGIQCSLSHQLALYAYIRNLDFDLNRNRYTNSTTSALCMQHKLNEQFTSFFEFGLSTYNVNYSIGFAYTIDQLKLLAGLSLVTGEIGSGVIIDKGSKRMIIALSYHPYLSISPSISYGSKI